MWCIHIIVSTRELLGKKLRFILSDRSDFYLTDSLSIAVYTFASRVLVSFSVDETLFPRYVNLYTSFRESPFSMEMSFLILIKVRGFHVICIDMDAYLICFKKKFSSGNG